VALATPRLQPSSPVLKEARYKHVQQLDPLPAPKPPALTNDLTEKLPSSGGRINMVPCSGVGRSLPTFLGPHLSDSTGPLGSGGEACPLGASLRGRTVGKAEALIHGPFALAWCRRYEWSNMALGCDPTQFTQR
jgi:hypothetical protein